MSQLARSVLSGSARCHAAVRGAIAVAACLVLLPAAVVHAENGRVTETPRNRDAETVGDIRIECARMGGNAQAVAKQWKDATDAQFGEGLPEARRAPMIGSIKA